MSDMPLNLEQTLLSTKDASALSGYNADYLSRLCRSGKIAGTQVGRTWLVDRNSLEQFVREQEERKRAISNELSQTREKEYQQAQKSIPAIRAARVIAKRPVRSPFTKLLRQPMVAFVASFFILATSVYAGTIGPIAQSVEHAGTIATAVQQSINGSESAVAPRLRVASNIAAASTGIPTTRATAQRVLKPTLDAKTIASMIARIDVPDARAETGHRIVAYDYAADIAASLQESRAHDERAFGRFMADREPISTRAIDVYVAIGTGIRDSVNTVLDGYANSLNREGNGLITLGATTRDAVAFAPHVTTALLDTYAHGINAWVDGSNTAVAYTADTETAAGPAALALANTARNETHAVALALQTSVDAQVSALHGAVRVAQTTKVPSVQLATVQLPNVTLPTVPVVPIAARAHITANALSSQWSAMGFGRTIALATYDTIHGLFDGTRSAFGRVLAFFRGDTRLAVVPIPPPVTVPGFNTQGDSYPVSATTSYVAVGGSGATYVTNYFTVNGVTKAMLDQAIDSLDQNLSDVISRHSGGGSSSGGSVVAGAITGSTLNLSGDATIGGNLTTGGTITSGGAVTAPYFIATSVTATSSLPNLTTNSFNLGSDYITSFTGNGLAIVNGHLTATATTSNSFQQNGNIFGAPAVLGTIDTQPLSFITNNLARMTIDSNGNVGIGTSTPGSLLSVAGVLTTNTVNATSLTATSSLPHLATVALSVGGDYLTAFTGNGLSILGGVLGLDSSNNYFSTTSTNFWLGTKSTTDLAEGSNLYFTNARADARINATSTIGTLTSAPNLGTLATSLNGVLKATNGVLSAALAGVDYENPLTFAAPLSRIGNNISIPAAATNVDGYLSAADWNTFNTKFATTSTDYWLTTKSTSNLAEGSNLYFTNARADARINATSTIGTLTSAPNLGTVATTLTGLLKANTGVLSAAIAGTDYQAPFTATYPIQFSANNLTLAFGTTTANAWSQLQQFNGGFTATNGTSTTFDANTLGVGSSYFTSLTGSGLLNTGGVLTLDRTGNWAGTFANHNSAYYLNLANQTGTLASNQGGTGFNTYNPGDVLYADITGTLQTLPVGSTGQVLKIQGGIPSWGVDQTVGGGGSDGIFATSTGKIYPLDTSQTVLVGTNATSTSNSIFEVNGQAYISSKLSISTTTSPAALSVGGSGYFTGGLGIGVLNSVAGTLHTSGNANIGGALAVTGNTTLAAATSTSEYTSIFGLNNSYFTSLTGSGLLNTGGVLTLDRTGDWTGTFSGHTSTYYLDANNLNNFGAPFYSFFHATTTDALAEGTNNLYWTNTRFDNRLSATTTLPNITSLPNLGTVSTSLTGLLKATAGMLSVATPGTDFQAPFTATYPIQFSANNLSLAFGTTTANSWSQLQQFNGGATSTQLTVTGNTYLATAGGSVGVGTTTPWGLLSINPNGINGPAFVIGSSTATKFLVNNGGQVAIGGAVSSTNALTVNGSTMFSGAATVNTASSVVSGIFTVTNTSGNAQLFAGGAGAGNSAFKIGGGTTAATSTTIVIGAAAQYGLAIRAATSQTADLQDWLDGAGNTLSVVNSSGQFGIGTSTPGSLLSIGNTNGINFSTATSTFSSTGGINLTGGCFAVNGSCIGGNLLSFTYPLVNTANTISLAFGTTTANTWSQLQTFTSGFVSKASSTIAGDFTTTGNTSITGGLGVGVTNTAAGTIQANGLIQTSGSFQTGAQFLGLGSDGASAPSFSWSTDPSAGIFHAGANTIGFSTSGIERARIASSGFFGIGTSTPGAALSVEGNALIHGTATIDGLGSGLVKSTNGLLGLAAAGTDYAAPFTATYPIVYSANNLSLAFGTTTANSWSQLQQFNGGATTTQLTVTGNTYLATAGGFVGVGTTSPTAKLEVNGSTAFYGATAINTTGTNALYVGPLGTSTPSFQVDNSAISSGNGIKITTTSAGGGVTLAAVSANVGETLTLLSKGGGTILVGNGSTGNIVLNTSASETFQTGGIQRFAINANTAAFTPGTTNTASAIRFSVQGTADAALTASTEAPDVYFNLSQIRTHANGALPIQRDFRITPSTHAFSGAGGTTAAQTIASTSALSIDGPPTLGAFANYTNAYGLFIGSGTSYSPASTTNAYGLAIQAPSGAVNNFAAEFLGGNVGIGTSTPGAALSVEGNALIHGTATIDGLGSGLVKSTNGLLGLAAAGTDYLTPGSLSATYPILYSGNNFSLAFGTTTANSWSQLQAFNGGLTATTIQTSGAITAGTQFLALNADSASTPGYSWAGDTSTGIFHGSANTIGFTTAGIERARIDTSGFFGIGTTTPRAALSVEGNALIHGTATIDGLGSGLVKSTNGLLGLAAAGIDYLAPGSLSALYPIQYSAGTGVFSLAFGTTTANSWSQLQQFNGGATSTQLTVTGNTYLASAGGSVGVGTTTPFGDFAIAGTGNKVYLLNVVGGTAQSGLSVGAINLQAGTGRSSAIAGNGGGITLIGGNAGNGSTQNGNGGSVYIVGGLAGSGVGSLGTVGNVLLGITQAGVAQGSVGIGTTTPGSLLSIGNTNGINFSTATSTFSSTGGINLANGCFAVNGTCIGGNTLSFTYPLINTANTISLAFGTTTANSWSQLQTFTSGFIAQSSSTIAGDFTTTGNTNITGGLGVGTANSVAGTIQATGLIQTSGNIQSGAQFLALNADSASTPGYSWAGDTSTGIFHGSANTIGFTTAGIERARIDTSGNFGIGTTTPGSLLSIGNTNGINFSTATSTFSSTGGINLTNGCYAVNGTCIGGFNNTLANGGTATSSFYAGGVVFSDGTKLTQAAGSGSAAFTWDNANNRLGIGTTTPTNTLEVNGTTYLGGTTAIVSSATNAFTVGTAGAGSLALQVNTSATGNGLAITPGLAGAGLALQVLSTNSNDGLTINAKGSGTIGLGSASTGSITIGNSGLASSALNVANGGSWRFQSNGTVTSSFGTTVTLGAINQSTTGNARLLVTGTTDTNLTASTEAPDVYFNEGQNRTHATGAIVTQRDIRITGSTHAFLTGTIVANTIASSSVLSIDGPVAPGTFANITNAYGLFVGGGASPFTTASTTNAYAAFFQAPTGATNNFAAGFDGLVNIRSTIQGTAALTVNATNLNSGIPALSLQANGSPFFNIVPDGNNNFAHLNTVPGGWGFDIQIQAVSALTVANNRNVGVGTTTPWGLLSVNPSVIGSGVPEFVIGSSTATHFIVNGAGNVGIGTTSPNNKLEVNGNTVISSNSANALTVGPNGLGSPTLQIDASTANAATGIAIKGAAAGGGVALTAISSGTNEALSINAKGSGNTTIASVSTGQVIIGNISAGNVSINTGGVFGIGVNGNVVYNTNGTFFNSVALPSATAANARFKFVGAADLLLTAGTEAPSVLFDMSNSRQHSNGAITLQRDFRIAPSTHTFVSYNGGGNIITDAAALSIDGTPIDGVNAKFTNAHGLLIQSSTLDASTTNAYGLTVNAPTGAANNYAAEFLGGNVGIGTTTPTNKLEVNGTTYLGGATTVVSNSVTAFAVGPNGTSNPAFQVDASTTNAVTGLRVSSFASGGGTRLDAISSNANEVLTVASRGTSNLNLNAGNGATSLTVANSAIVFQASNSNKGNVSLQGWTISSGNAQATASQARISLVSSGADLNLTTGAEAQNLIFNMTAIRTHLNGAIAVQRELRIEPATHAFTGAGGTIAAQTIASSSVVSIDGPPILGAFANFTNTSGLYIGSGGVYTSASTTVASGLTIDAPTGALYNNAATFNGNVGIGTTTGSSQLTTTGSVQFYGIGGGSLQTDAQGHVTISSDERLKDINGSFTDGLAQIEQLNPILYHWNATSSLDMVTQYAGFSAQNVKAVIPTAVGMDSRGYLTLSDRPILAASVNAIKELASSTVQLSLATSSLGARVDNLEKSLAAQIAAQGQVSPFSATDIQASSISVTGNALATSFVVPATPITFSMGSTTGTIPSEVLTDTGGVDLYKAATYAITGVQYLAARTDALANRLDAVELRVAMLEAEASSTPSTGGTLSFDGFKTLLAQAGVLIQDGIAHFGSIAFTNLIASPAADGTSSVATSTIPVGQTEVAVVNPLAHPTSKIFVTITSPLSGSWYISQKAEGSFTITLSGVQTQDVTFDYFIVQTGTAAQVAGGQQADPHYIPLPPTGSSSDGSSAPSQIGTSTPSAPVAAAPTITLNDDAAVDVVQGGFWTDPGATAKDAAGADLTAQIAVSGTVDVNTPGLYTITYSVVDGAGVSATASRVVHVSAPSVSAPESPVASAPDTGTGA
jgi:fibronectin-binding autotransporter adhesin